MAHRKGRKRNKNLFAKDLRTPKYRKRIVPNKKKKLRNNNYNDK